MLRAFLRSRIRNRLRDYKVTLNEIDPSKPETVSTSVKVAVVGAGLAGIGAASLLAERGFAVTLFERNSYLGGKVGSWNVAFAGGYTTKLDHGFHAFFRHYYNLRTFLEKIGATHRFRAVDDYLILARDGKRYGFRNVETAPVLNIFSLGRQEFFRFRDLLHPASWKMGEFLQYDEARTFARYDGMTFKEFADEARLPPPLELTFQTFARAFFAPAEKLSAAELVKSFHFFYLSHDHGLLYDYFDTDYHEALLQPINRHLERHRVSIRLNRPVETIRRADEKFVVGADAFDHLVLASDAAATREICKSSPWIASDSPKTHSELMSLQASSGYAVYRIWLDKRIAGNFPVFVITEKRAVLDSVTFYDRFDDASAGWARASGGGVYELHCYALPGGSADSDVKAAFLAELHGYFPELRTAKIVYEHLQIRRDFTAFSTNLHKTRPGYRTEIANLYLAGDWVRTGTPAMLMEGAYTSGLLCANAILTKHGLREEPVHSVPPRGLFAKRN